MASKGSVLAELMAKAQPERIKDLIEKGFDTGQVWFRGQAPGPKNFNYPYNKYSPGVYYSSMPEGANVYSELVSDLVGGANTDLAFLNFKQPYKMHDYVPIPEAEELLGDPRKVPKFGRYQDTIAAKMIFDELVAMQGSQLKARDLLRERGYDGAIARGNRLGEKYAVAWSPDNIANYFGD